MRGLARTAAVGSRGLAVAAVMIGGDWAHAGTSARAASPSRGVLTVSKAPVVRLAWLDPAGIASGTEVVVQREVAKLLREMGVEVLWRPGDSREPARPGELRVIFLNRPAQAPRGVAVLGATPASHPGERLVWVHLPSVRAATALGPRTGPERDPLSARRLGIALGRVIAHEIVHAVAPALAHGGGLMAACLNRHMLTAASIAVDPQLGFAIRTALAGATPVSRRSDQLLAAASSSAEACR